MDEWAELMSMAHVMSSSSPTPEKNCFFNKNQLHLFKFNNSMFGAATFLIPTAMFFV